VGAVGYLNARPLVYGLEDSERFAVRYDVPSECARLLHADAIDIGLIPSIEYLRGGPYAIVPGVAIASAGPVASVVLYSTKPIDAVRSIALDTSSRTSVALVRVLCARWFRIQPAFEAHVPDLDEMLSRCDAALMIGDSALFLDRPGVEAMDLGEVWTQVTGLPFVYAFWAGRPGVLHADDIAALRRARDEGCARPEELARQYLAGRPERHALGARYLRENIKYHLGDRERAGLEAFYAFAAAAGVVAEARALCWFE
jgi:chorismate dehydratase